MIESSAGSRHRLFVVLALLASAAYVVAAFMTDANRLVAALSSMGWVGCGMVLALSSANYLLRFLRWQYYLSILGHQLPRRRHLLYYIGGFAFTASPGKAGEAMRSVYLREHGVPYSDSVATLFVERLLDILAMLGLASLFALGRRGYRPLIATVLLVTVMLLILVGRPSVAYALERFATHRRGGIARLLGLLARLLQAARALLGWRPLCIGLALGLLSWGAEAVGFGIICHGLRIQIGMPMAIGIYALGIVAGSAAVFLPAGIGGTEAVMTSLLVEQGAPLRAAIVATLVCRLATLWFAVLLGICATSTIELHDRVRRGRVTT